MGRDKKWYGTDIRRGYVFGRFYRKETSQPLKIKLIRLDDLEFKETKRGLVKRSEREKLAVLQQLYAEKQKELDGKHQQSLSRGDLVADVFAIWLDAVADLREVKTLNHYKDAVRHFFAVNPRKLRTSELGAEHFSKMARALAKQHSETTANSYLRDLRACVSWLHDQGLIKHAPRIQFFRSTTKKPEVFTEDELEQMHVKLLALAPTKRRWHNLLKCFQVLRWSGMRGSEVLHLKWQHIDFNARLIRLTESDGFRIKNRKEELIPLAEPLIEFLLLTNHENETWLLDDGRGNKYWKHLNELTAAMRRFQRSLGISGPKPLHGFRATLATQLTGIENANVYLVQRLLRHSSITTTMGYVNPEQQQIADLVNQLNKQPKRPILKVVNGSKTD